MTHYVEESDPEMREASNRTYHRIHASLPPEVARRYGHADESAKLEERLAEEGVARPAQRVPLFLELIHAGRRAERERHGLP